ncbi:MAG: T9SS type A sorting domain-containing protein, partial [Ignavibacteriae bacterium]|nr:T9SS type A sorting domain-containing protein [Ignavibacteriota bacterium]
LMSSFLFAIQADTSPTGEKYVSCLSIIAITALNLDGDNDGKVDNVCFVVYGTTTAWATLLWPHRWSLYTLTVNINGKRVYDYNFQIQSSLKSSGPGVLCHEMFHSLGSPDLYHYVSNGISPCHTWDLMCSNTNPPQHMGAYMKWKYATWISSLPIISTPGVYTLKPVTSQTNNCYRINSPYSSTEYFVVEFRRKALPFENTIPGSGLLVYRINTLASGNANGPPDEVYIYRPNGTLTANGVPNNAYYSNLAGKTVINNTTNPPPFLSNGAQGGLNIYNVISYDTLISFTLGVSSGVHEINGIASEYKLNQNYPNPFNPNTKINFRIKESVPVTLKIYDILGKEISTIVNVNLKTGIYEVNWYSEKYPSGIYFYKLETGKFSDIKKMMLVK